MSFFTSGFSGLLNSRRKKKASPPKDDDKKKSSDKKDEGKWEMLTDAYGRTYWQHSVTGEWRFTFGGGLVSPVGTVNPSPVVGYPGAVFTPSPVFAPPPPPPAKKKDDEKKKKEKGYWETFYDDDGDRYYEHTVTKKVTYKDPYV